MQRQLFFVLQAWLYTFLKNHLEILVKEVESSKGECDEGFMAGPWFISLSTAFVLVSPVYSN